MDNIEKILQSLDSHLENNQCDGSFLSEINIKELNNDEDFSAKDSEVEKDKKNISKKYSDYGYEIHQHLKEKARSSYDNFRRDTSSWKSKPSEKSKQDVLSLTQTTSKVDVYAEPIFGLRLINPTVSSHVIQTKMTGRIPVPLNKLSTHLNGGDKHTDWVFAGAIVFKSGLRTSQKGSQYCLWKISDLKHDLKQITVYLFGKAGSELWKLALGSVVAILNASSFNKEETVSKDDITLSVKNADQVMIWGMSKDYGICKAKKKNGENCTSFVNKSICEFCLYHVKTEYNKYTGKRFDLQASYSNGMTELRNKVLGKNEVFYGGKSFTAIKPAKSKHHEKEKSILNQLSMNLPSQPVKDHQKMISEDKKRLEKLEYVQKSNPNYKNKSTPDKPVVSARTSLMKAASQKLIQTGEITRISAVNFEKRKTFTSFADVFNPENGDKFNENNKKSSGKNNTDSVSFNFEEIKTLKPCNEIIFDFDEPIKTKFTVVEKQIKNLEKHSSTEKVEAITKTNNSLLQSQNSKKTENFQSSFKTEINKKNIVTKNPKSKILEIEHDKNIETNIDHNFLKSGMQAMLGRSIGRSENSIHKQKLDQAKLNAVRLVKQKGGLEKINPNRVRPKSGDGKRVQTIKRALETEEDAESPSEANILVKSVLSERFIELMNSQSAHENLIQIAADIEEQNYFNKMEKKEQLEEKMLSTYKIPCKAVTCLKCKYKWFSASDLCKSEGHPIKIIDAMKRFFKCLNCSNRTVSLEIVPLLSCKNCGSSKWSRAPMIKDKVYSSNSLSIRGDEVKYLDSFGQKPNLNLLVPE